MAEFLRQILEFLVVDFLGPICGLECIQPTNNIIQSDQITSQVKHIGVPISYIDEKFDLQKLLQDKILTHI